MVKKTHRSSAQDYDASQSGSGVTGNDLFRVRKEAKASEETSRFPNASSIKALYNQLTLPFFTKPEEQPST